MARREANPNSFAEKLFRYCFVAHYAFETPEFGLNENGLHRLRSRFPFESLPYNAITQAEVKRGKTVQNWWLLLAFGVLCLGVAGYVAYGIFWFFKFGHGKITVQEVAVPIIPAFLGIAAIRQALRVDDILPCLRWSPQTLISPPQADYW